MIPLEDLHGNLEKLLTGDCLEYTTKLLAEAAKLFAGNYPHLKTIMEGYEKITAPGQGGYVFLRREGTTPLAEISCERSFAWNYSASSEWIVSSTKR